jgi:hypothetical protein
VFGHFCKHGNQFKKNNQLNKTKTTMDDPTTPTPSGSDSGGNPRYKSIDELLKLAKIAIENGMSQPDLAEPLALKGYDSTEMTNGKNLYTRADALHTVQKGKYGDKVDAKDEFDSLRREIESDYGDHVDLARIA